MVPEIVTSGMTVAWDGAVAGVLTSVTTAVETLAANPLVLTAFAIPVTFSIVSLCKKLFKRK